MLPEVLTPIPGPKSHELAKRLRQVESQNVTYIDSDFPIFWDKALGNNVWDVDGNRFLDVTGAFAVTTLGHNALCIQGAVVEQAEKLIHAMGDVHPAEVKVRLCERLSEITFQRWSQGTILGKTILCNSGFEAVEAALKTAFLYNKKPGVIAFTGAYHGLGYGALEVGGLPYFREPFRPQLKDFATLIPYPYCYQCPFGETDAYRLEGKYFPNCSNVCLEKIESQIREAIQTRPIGSIIVEPVQGRGGDVFPPLDFLRLLRTICDEYKILLILDEIYTGFHRTGTLFACEHAKVMPDIICLGKGLTNGFPLSACVARSHVMDAWPKSNGEALHTSTFLGHPLGCAMALASLEVHAPSDMEFFVNPLPLTEQAYRVGKKLKSALANIQSPRIGNIRGAGLMFGVELTESADFVSQLMKQALKNGLILLGGGPAGNVLSFAPSIQTTDEEIEWLQKWLGEALKA